MVEGVPRVCELYQLLFEQVKMFGLSDDRYFGLRGGWLTLWVTVACGTDMTLFG